MRKLTLMVAAFLLIGILGACDGNATDNMNNNQGNSNAVESGDDMGNNTTEDNDVQPDNNTENNQTSQHDDAVTDNDEATKRMKELNIEEIQLEIDYGDDREYEAEIELKSDGTYTAELDDELNDEYSKGQDAFDTLYPLVKKLDLNEDSSKEEVFSQVLKAFDLKDDYEKIDVEIKFHDSNKELEYEEKR